MFAFICKRSGSPVDPRISRITQLGYLQISPLTSFSSQSTSLLLPDKSKQQESFVVSYLVNNCGLSLEVAISKSNRLHFESSLKPDSVITLFKDHGFTSTHITKLITTCPNLLLADPDKTLLPKLEFYRSIGASNCDLASGPALLNYSLHKRVIPCYQFLRSMLLSDQNAILVLKRLSCNFLHDVQSNLAPNVALLKQVGVPQHYISVAVLKYPHIMSTETHRFDDSVKEVLKMGFDPSKVCFVQALSVICGQTKLSWEHKKVVYKRWGWSDHEISSTFRKHPLCMIKSESKIMNVMDFLVNKMGFQSSAIVRTTNVLYYRLEKRIIPMCSDVRFLVLKGLLKKVPTIGTFIRLSEECFIDKFVKEYLKQFPQLLSVYQGK
ncbi:hypothetical protein RJ639_022210 [Escallonia herrerae]|uniref:Uncharacterized protein n=1 Tax=Escallonia herrerae TaxID=1293975 RepID=A0AA88V604_9ASTE|nr:hypothetical protein RJ639_022210 [Escallonia herrerae]